MADRNDDIAPPDRVNILGIGVHALTMPLAVELVEQALRKGNKGYVCVTGVHGIMEAQNDSKLEKALNSSFLTTPDGMPTVWFGRARGHAEMERVFGPDLMLEVCRMSVEKGYTHFLYGGAEGVAEELRDELEQRFPGIKISGVYTPPFRPLDENEEKDLIRIVAKIKPDLFWVGISTPKQDLFMHEYIEKLDTKLMLGVGAAFDFHTGRIKDSPNWVKKAGLQWLHRLLQEPRRLWKRYLYHNPRFVYLALSQLLGGKTE